MSGYSIHNIKSLSIACIRTKTEGRHQHHIWLSSLLDDNGFAAFHKKGSKLYCSYLDRYVKIEEMNVNGPSILKKEGACLYVCLSQNFVADFVSEVSN